ncbi:MAG: hypothetical protein K6T65_00500 [Peptococcaceae bacterium]|nr:hypothetical protein [Peptococcaceae bacterium]
MEGRIKTALEKAMERAASMREVSREEIERLEYVPQGRSIGASFMHDRSFNLKNALAEIPAGIVQYVREGVQDVLLMNITLSADESASQSNRRAMEGIMDIKQDKAQATRVLGEMDLLLQHYFQTLNQTKERFKQELELRKRTLRRQGPRSREMEAMEFREEWANVIKQLNAGYEANLNELKDRLRNIN